jgi:type I restriction enzyme S subunit
MSFPRYPKYKDSGVEWLGQVPEHWNVKRLRFVVELNPSKSEVNYLDRDTTISFLPMDAIGDDGTLRLDQEKTISEVESGYTYFRDGDVTVAKITPCYENGKGALMRGLVNGIGFGTTELIVARPKPEEITGTYLNYLFISPDFRSLGESHMYGAGGQKRVPDAFVRNFATAFPPISEQTRIAEFLDQETAKIDALVAEQERLMALLKEKRQAVISHAVTKGLNPNTAMKPSGIEWLGDVPAHWEYACLTRIASRIVVGIAEAATHAYADEGIPILRSTNIRAGRIRGDILFIDPEFAGDRGSKQLNTGDLVTVRTGNAGVTAVIPPDFDGCQCFTMLITTLNHGSSSEYYCYWMNSVSAQCYFSLEGWGTAQVNISVPILKALPIPIPPTSEQKEIVEHLDREIGKFDTLTAEAQRAIDLLQERRTALISAAVTGQIDVRQT